MNEYYPGSKSYLLFHPCSPASFCSLWTASLKAARQWRSSLTICVKKKSENCVFLVIFSLKMEPWLKSTLRVSGTVSADYTQKLFLLWKSTLKWNAGGNGCGLNLKNEKSLCTWGRKWNSFGWQDRRPLHLLILFCLNGKFSPCERHINLEKF